MLTTDLGIEVGRISDEHGSVCGTEVVPNDLAANDVMRIYLYPNYGVNDYDSNRYSSELESSDMALRM